MTKTVCTPDGGTLWLRREPGGEKLARIPCGQTVTVTAEEGGWSAVAWNGKNGWCDSSFLREEDVTLTLPRSAAEALKAALSGGVAP